MCFANGANLIAYYLSDSNAGKTVLGAKVLGNKISLVGQVFWVGIYRPQTEQGAASCAP
jgi:hypothetical protein